MSIFQDSAVITFSRCSAAWTVTAVYESAPVDRQTSMAWTFTDRRIADRLARAIESGAALTEPSIATDELGRTYVKNKVQVVGRHASRILNSLGF